MAFKMIQVILTTTDNVLNVPDVYVRRKGHEDFFLNGSPVSNGPNPLPVGLSPSQPFSLGPCETDPDPKYKRAKLQFDQGAISSWHTLAFDPCLALLQVMDIPNLGTAENLEIDLSCTEHPLQVAGPVVLAFLAVTEAFIAIVATFVLFLKRTYGRPAQANETHANEPSRSTG
jgi:hypothetical protein